MANSSELTFKLVGRKSCDAQARRDRRRRLSSRRAGQISSPRDAHAHLQNLISRPKKRPSLTDRAGRSRSLFSEIHCGLQPSGQGKSHARFTTLATYNSGITISAANAVERSSGSAISTVGQEYSGHEAERNHDRERRRHNEEILEAQDSEPDLADR